MNIEFFERLYVNREFCEALGRMILAAGRFESNLSAFLRLNGVDISDSGATFGSLISKLKKHDLLSESGVQVLRDLKFQRNYLIHSLFDLFSARIPETVLPRNDLVPMDVITFTEKANQLEENLIGLSSIAERRIAQIEDGTSQLSGEGARLFRP